MSAALHAHTPTLTVLDSRGLPVRSTQWYRADAEAEAESRVTHWLLDAAQRNVEQRDPRLFAASAPRPNLATVYSLSGNLLFTDSVDAGWHAVLLSEDGLPVERQDSRNSRMRHEYDELRRLTAVFETPAGEAECCTERFVYGDDLADPALNLRQQLLRHDDPAGTRHMGAYDLNGLLQQEVQHFLSTLDTPDWPEATQERDALLELGDGMLSQWVYSPWGEQLRRVDAAGNEHRQQLDVAGRLIASTLRPSAQSEPITLVEQIRYNAFDQIEVQLAGNGLISENSYDPADGKLTRLKCSPGNNAPALQDLVYAYDPMGNVVRQEDLTIATRYLSNQRIDPISAFTYDSLYKLTEATGRERLGAGQGPELPGVIDFSGNDATLIGTYTRRYQYDAGGNLRVMQHQGQNGQTHRLEMAVSEISNKSIPWCEGLGSEDIENAFDPNGNLAQLQPGQNLHWDLRNQLAQVTLIERENGQHDAERYVYGGGGRRLRKHATRQASGVMHHSEVRYLPGLELHEDSATGQHWQVVNIETGRGSARWMHWLSTPPTGLSENALYFGFDNRLGSVTLETDELGQLVSREEYYPFGGTALIASRNEVEVTYKTIRYSGKERDATGLYYYGYRYLAPWLGRWLNPDPAGTVDGLNVYGFVGNNPLTWGDGDGRMWQPPDDSIPPPSPASVDIAMFGSGPPSPASIDTAMFGSGPPSPASIDTAMFGSVPPSPASIVTAMFGSEPPSPAPVATSPFDSEAPSPASVDLNMFEPRAASPDVDHEGFRRPAPPAPFAGKGKIRWGEHNPIPGLPGASYQLLTFAQTTADPSEKRGASSNIRDAASDFPSFTTTPTSYIKRKNIHYVVTGNGPDKKYVCIVNNCNKEYKTRTSCLSHIRLIHEKSSNFKCPFCQKNFTNISILNDHIYTHTNTQHYKCAFCAREFNQKNHFNDHQKYHANPRAITCATCNTSFARPDSLALHKRRKNH